MSNILLCAVIGELVLILFSLGDIYRAIVSAKEATNG